MTYRLIFKKSAKKEWDKLAEPIKKNFKKKLIERLDNPIVVKDKLSGHKDCYKIKLRTVGYRLAYKVILDKVVVQVIAVGKRDKDLVYKLARTRLTD